MKFSAVLLTATCAFPLITSAQDHGAAAVPVPTISATSTNLQVTAEAKLAFLGGLAGRVKCDAEGNIYLRPTDSETSERYHPISALPIRKIKPDGSLASSFSVADGWPGLRAIDFFVAADGKVYQAARSETDRAVYLVSYLANGSPRSKVRLDADFFLPYEIAVFPSGEILVSGIYGSENRTPFTAVFNANGRLIKEIYEPEDEDSRKRAEAGEPGFRPSSMDFGNDFVAKGDAVAGSDGNVYLLRAASPALIFVISPKGEVLRKLRIGSPGSELSAARLKSAPGLLAISFLQKGRNTGILEVVDYKGKEVASYAPSDKRMYPGLLGCFSLQSFTFLSLNDGDYLHLNRAEAK
ncbi:MAG TPA: hypothetical protein VKF84_05620 [Candidatus Sulfotelmatobacter sp.]|nr:hypothetical protein [Candidatus Sulfotelmatobacter sp.]